MHIPRGELRSAPGAAGESILAYPTAEGQDCESLERFRIRTLAPGAVTDTETVKKTNHPLPDCQAGPPASRSTPI